MASMSAFMLSVKPNAPPPRDARKRAGNIMDGTTGVSDATIRSMHSSSMPSPWSMTSMDRSRAMWMARRLAMWPRTRTPRRWAASIPAAISSLVISTCSLGPMVP